MSAIYVADSSGLLLLETKLCREIELMAMAASNRDSTTDSLARLKDTFADYREALVSYAIACAKLKG